MDRTDAGSTADEEEQLDQLESRPGLDSTIQWTLDEDDEID